MSPLELIALIAGTLWLGILTLGLLLAIRQISILTLRVEAGSFSVADDGLPLGSPVPQEVLEALPLSTEPVNVLVMSASCRPCREVAEELHDAELEGPLVVLLPGADDLAAAVRALLPSRLPVVADPDAHTLAEALGIKSTPFAVSIADGAVVGKTYVNHVVDLQRLAHGPGADLADVPELEVATNVG